MVTLGSSACVSHSQQMGTGIATIVSLLFIADAAARRLDTIMRFTPTARLLRAALGLSGMRLLSATAAWAECCLPSIALLAAAMKAPILQASTRVRTRVQRSVGFMKARAPIASTSTGRLRDGHVLASCWDRPVHEQCSAPLPHRLRRLDHLPPTISEFNEGPSFTTNAQWCGIDLSTGAALFIQSRVE